MASSTVHLAIIEELLRKRKFTDPDRLRFGAVLPDFRKGGNSHFSKHFGVGTKKTNDINRFREMFGEKMRTDDLYLGYYLHLFQDIGYRHFVYDVHDWDPLREGNVERLHNDYAIVNPYIVSKYGLKKEIVVPNGFFDEPLSKIAEFDTDWLLKSMEEFVTTKTEGEIFFFTHEMTDTFIVDSVNECMDELGRMDRGEPMADGDALAWEKAVK